ncbi:MAG: lamin tail domain-containing protein [Methylotenera sp.]|uniref:lamin tail domain-containing protein n=1 Tax=Methylotenera sp. TaxID=2051956 RepID=UPI002715703D|nr:lamin tail domain-containing protein [Methylotenera sp.]MDO9149898.1 lamin tail domain-containing protein [Methylotenera sp.]
MKKTLPLIMAALLATISFQANAAIAITEVAPWGSGDAPYASDWFELTNTGATTIDISGWKVDDSSNSFAAALALKGVTNIAAGQSVIFIESADGAAIPSFISTWFSSNTAPLVGYYSGSGIGLSTAGDAVNIFNAAGIRQANVSFGASDNIAPFQTFDNSSGINGVISKLSVVGENGAFVAVNDTLEIGSPGTIAAVPEPENYAMLLAGLGLIGFTLRKRHSK